MRFHPVVLPSFIVPSVPSVGNLRYSIHIRISGGARPLGRVSLVRARPRVDLERNDETELNNKNSGGGNGSIGGNERGRVWGG